MGALKKFFKTIGVISLVLIIGILIFIGYIYFDVKNNQKKYAEKVKKIEAFESLNSDDYFEYSGNINKSGNFTTGFKFLNYAVKLEPKKHLGYRGWIHLRKLRNYDKALKDFNRLDSLTPTFTDAPLGEDIDFLRGECFYGNKDYKTAIKYFNQSIKNQKGDEWADVQTLVYLGISEYNLKNYSTAIKEFERALKQSEYTCEAYFGLAKSYYKLNNINKANYHILKAEENIDYKRNNGYNEFLNEIYLSEIIDFKEQLNKIKL